MFDVMNGSDIDACQARPAPDDQVETDGDPAGSPPRPDAGTAGQESAPASSSPPSPTVNVQVRGDFPPL